jgi:hypothetical protein
MKVGPNLLSYIFPYFFLCNYTLLPVYIKVLDTCWKTFCEILIPSMLTWVEEQVKNKLEPRQECMGDAPLLSHCSLLRNP